MSPVVMPDPSRHPDSTPGPRLALAATVEGLYAAFDRYKLHHPVVGCPCCTSSEDDRRVRVRPLRRLEWADLERYAWKAVTTLGTVNDLKHFLPRLLELAAEPDVPGLADVEVLMGKLDYAGWGRWPAHEVAAVRAYLSALWRHVLGAFPSSPDADTCLCGVGAAEDDLRPYLGAWGADGSPAAAMHLADFIDNNALRLLKGGRLASAFWSGRRAQMQQVIDWLFDSATVARLEGAFFACPTPADAEALSHAVDRLDWVRRQRAVTGV